MIHREWLRECAFHLGEPPRRFTWWDKFSYLRVPTPAWMAMNPEDHLNVLFKRMNKIYEHGVLVWGYIIQANSKLFKKEEKTSAPAETVFSLDEDGCVSPTYLNNIATACGLLRGEHFAHRGLQRIGDYLENQLERVFGLPVPTEISDQYDCMISTTYIVRKHLPEHGRFLALSYFPLLVYPDRPHVAMMVPSKFWPNEFRELWVASANDRATAFAMDDHLEDEQ